MDHINKLLRISFLVALVGWIMIWIMLPTQTYTSKWTPHLTQELSSTYFQDQGTNLLLFTFPIVFIAVFGCIYLHLQKKPDKSSSKSGGGKSEGRLAWLRRPVVVVSPLGIVTAIELTFGVMFIALLVWSLANYLKVSFGHLHMHKVGEKVWEAKFRSVSLRLGYIGNICWAFLFFPVTRTSSLLPLVGLSSESSIKYHIGLGHISMVLFVLHTIGFIIYWAMTNQMVLMLEWSSTWVSNVAGEIAIVLAIAMWVTSFRPVRRKMFEVFFYTHHLYTFYIIFYVLHVGADYFCMIIPGIFLFCIDRYLRFLQSRHRTRVLAARLLPCGVVELTFAKSFEVNYNPTSIVFINIPGVSKLQWHPFTVISSCNMEADRLSVAIKCEGSWSHKLYQTLSSSSMDRLEASVEGPYGPISSHFALRHEEMVLVSGGSGITPFISIIRELIAQTNHNPSDTIIPKSILLVCAFKDSSDLAILDLLLPIQGTPHNLSQLNLQIQAYISQEQKQDDQTLLDQKHKMIQTLGFKPTQLDSSIIPILGPNTWLWLGAIITSSFLMFLILLGIVTRYYVNSNMTYHFSYWCLWDMFLLCVCVFLGSSVAFLLRKRKIIEMERKRWNQVKSVEIPTPTATPGSWFHEAERELESLPHQSLVQATKVHFGTRPDLKKILFECKGSDVGVFVCGPRKMRHEAAKICSSGLADNLHFESISFDW